MARQSGHPAFKLEEAISRYSYPASYFDFARGADSTHADGTAGIEQMLQMQMWSGNPTVVKHGLANVIHWAFARNARERTRFRNHFLTNVTATQIDDFMQLVAGGRTPSLQELFALKLPIYSGIATASKVLMFLDPNLHVTLDSKIAQVQYEPTNQSRSIVGLSIGQLRNTAQNRQAYVDWCEWCCELNTVWFHGKKRAVDIERGIFQLVSEGNLSFARDIYRKALP